MMLLHFRVALSLYVTPKQALRELEGPQRLLSPFKGEHLVQARTSQLPLILPKGQAPRFPHGWLKISSSPGYPIMTGVDHGGRVQWKSSAGRSLIQALFRTWWNNLEVPMGSGVRPWV